MVTSEWDLSSIKDFANQEMAVFHLTTDPTPVSFIGIKPDGRTISIGDKLSPEFFGWNAEVSGWPVHLRFSKEGYKTFDVIFSKADVGGTEWNLHVTLEEEVIPKYPKDVTRDPYTITVDDLEQETQAKEFLGIEPPGDDLDTWLSKRDLAGLEEWKAYWTDIFSRIGMAFWIGFVNDKFEEYKAKLVVPPIPPEPPELTWWEKLLNLLKPTPLFGLTTIESLFKSGYELLTGKEMTDAEFIAKKAQLLDWILPINALTKLFLGKNLKGEAEEFGSAADYLDMALTVAAIIPVGKVAGTGAKLLLRSITKVEAAALTAKLGEKAVITKLLSVVKAHPETSAKILAKFPLAVREAVISGLYKTAAGRIAVVTLGKVGYFKYSASAWRRVVELIFKISTPVIALTLPIFAIAEIPNLFNMIQFARKQRLEAEGKWPTDIAYKLNEYENLMKDYTWKIDEAIKAEDKTTATSFLNSLKTTIEEYENYIEEKRADMLPEDYDLTRVALEFYSLYISDRETRIAALPEVPPEVPPEIPELPPEEVKGNLTISAIDSKGSAEGIIIEIAGEPDIVEPGTYELLTGSYSVKASKEGFISRTKTAYVNEAKDTVVSFILEEVEPPEELPTKATIIIISKPTNSDIYIDGDYTFTKTPYTTVLDAGTYIIRIQTDGYYPQEATVTFGAGDEMEVPFILQKIPPEVEPTVTYDPYQPYLPSYQPATYYTPAVQPTPYSQISLPDYSLIAAPTYKSVIEPVYPTVIEKEIMINIETTDVKPWKGKIFSIAWKDLTTPGAETQVIVDEDEKGILEAFMNEFNVGNYKTIIGYNLKFDYQWIFNKLMLYRIPANKFYETDMRDVYQLMSQVKEAFVYNARAYGKLDEYAKELLGIGKMGTQETLLKRYISGDTAYVEAFQVRQIEITNGLYQLFRYSASESLISPISSTPEEIPPIETPLSPGSPVQTGQKQCPNCKAFNPIENKECFICHQPLGP